MKFIIFSKSNVLIKNFAKSWATFSVAVLATFACRVLVLREFIRGMGNCEGS